MFIDFCDVFLWLYTGEMLKENSLLLLPHNNLVHKKCASSGTTKYVIVQKVYQSQK